MRENLKTDMDLKDIISIVYEYYLIRINSNILTSDEQLSSMNLLLATLKQNDRYKHIKSIDTEFLFRASDHQFKAAKFHEFCDRKGPTLTVIHNEYNHIFGGYCTESWQPGDSMAIADPTAFIYLIRPKCKAYKLKEENKAGQEAMMSDGVYGPEYGAGNDIWISDECNTTYDNGCNGSPQTFDIDPQELIGQQGHSQYHYQCYIVDYEVFSIQVS